MVDHLLMPKATAIWLIDNTCLSFEQISNFCKLHLLEVKAIADGESSQGIKGLNPISSGQLSREEILKGEKNSDYQIQLSKQRIVYSENKRRGSRYTPLSKRGDRPNAVLWLVRNYPDLRDSQISFLVGTTKSTIEQIRKRTHWNSPNLIPLDPVTLGLCSQIDFDIEISRALKRNKKKIIDKDETLLPTSTTENLVLLEHNTSSDPESLFQRAIVKNYVK